MINLRPYQAEAVESLYAYFQKNTGNPLVVLPTGCGKSLVLSEFIRRAIYDYADTRILCVTHVRELIAQNYAQLLRLWPDAPAGVYSAGLNRRDLYQQILFCGIQSVYKKASAIQRADLVLIDEAHLIGRNDAGMYRRFLKELTDINPWLKVVGLTATAYRLDSGYLHKGDGALFDAIAYEANLGDMVEQGYLSPLTTKRTKTTLDVTGVKVRGGEFVAGDLERAVNVQDINEAIAAEIIEKGADRGSWLVFAAGVDHAKALCALLPDAACVFGETPVAERDQIIGEFKRGRLRALVNVGVLTTGFDAPGVDLIAMCRPTKSTGLYVQQLGRGTRLAEGKENCILEGQRVLTDHGLVPIENVTTKMKVWDGVCFVSHDGAVFRGEQEVVTYAGLTATADHKVWTAEGWSSFGECATKQTPIAVTGDGRKTIRQIEGHFRRDSSEERKGSSTHIRRVWDILNSGPIHRFTVEGLLVSNCVVLDFAGNIARFGPADAVQPPDPGKKGDGVAPVKTCPQCESIVHASRRVCPDCGHVFPAPDPGKKLAHKATQEAVLTRDIADTWLEVTDIRYREHLGQSGVPSMRVEYQCGPLSAYSEYVCLEHTGYARERAVMWWQKRAPGTQVPRSVSSAIPVAELLPRPTHIQVRPDGKYFRIQGVRFNG